MKRYYRLSLIQMLVFLLISCAGKSFNPRLNEFSRATSVMEESVVNIFDKMQKLEMDVRGEEATEKSIVSPSDFQPRIFSPSSIYMREMLMKSLSDYSKSLLILTEGGKEDITQGLEEMKESFISLSKRHPDLFSKNQKGILFTLSTAIPKAITIAKRRKIAIEIMKKMQTVIKKVSEKLGSEIESLLILTENYYSRLFHMKIEKRWPEKMEKREKISSMALKLIKEKYKLKKNLENLKRTVAFFPKAHMSVFRAFGMKSDAVEGIRLFVDYVYKLKKSFIELKEAQ